MGSSRAEEQRDESARINPQDSGDIGEAGKHKAGTSLAGEKQPPFVDPGDVAATNPAGVQQHGAGDQPENEPVVKERQDIDGVFGETEKELEKYDERERLLTEAYRVKEKQRKEVANSRRKSHGNTTYNRVESDWDTNDDDSCYIEIKNLVFIENSVIHKKALEEWVRKEKLFASRVERKSTKLGSLKNEVFQLIVFSVFQGLVVTATSQTNLLPCSSRWSAILLSVLASILIIVGVFQKLMQISSLKKTIDSEEQALKDVVHRSQTLRRDGKDFVFAKFSKSKKKWSKEGYSTYAVGVLSFLLVFTVVFPISQWRSLCYPGGAPPPA